MKTPKEIKQTIEDADAWGKVREFINNEEEDDTIAGLAFQWISSKRRDESMFYTFNIEGQTFQCRTAYESWNDWGLELYDVKSMWPVVQAEKTVKFWKEVPWE